MRAANRAPAWPAALQLLIAQMSVQKYKGHGSSLRISQQIREVSFLIFRPFPYYGGLRGQGSGGQRCCAEPGSALRRLRVPAEPLPAPTGTRSVGTGACSPPKPKQETILAAPERPA